MAKTIKTNEQLVKDLMTYSPYGALSQAFIMSAIQSAAEAVAKADPKLYDSGFMNGAAWVGVAKDIKARCDAFYNRHNEEHSMELFSGNTNKVIVSRAEVADFNRQCPCSELRDRSYWFEFDARGDLIDTDVPEQDDGAAAIALAIDAHAFWINNKPA